MPTHLLPSKSELTAIRRALSDANVTLTEAAEQQCIRDFKEGAFTTDTVDSYIVATLKPDHPEFWREAALDEVIEGERAEQIAKLEAAAFDPQSPSVTARGALVRAVGIVEATAAAKKAGLAGLHDYSKVKPGEERKRPSASNPYTWAHGEERDAEIARLVRTLPTKLVQSLSRSANCRIDGRPLV